MNNWKHYAGSVLLAGLLLQGCSDTPTDDTAAKAPVNTNAKASAMTANTLSALVDGQTLQDAKLAYASGEATTMTDAKVKVEAIIAALVADGSLTQEDADALLNSDLNELYMEAYFDAIAQIKGLAPAPQRIFGIGTALKNAASKVTDKLKDGLVDVMDSSIGNKITNAAFEVVLNSEGVTVFMLDLARQSDTIALIMLDAIGANWTLVKKMAPMLRENKEFGEKFAALAYEYEPMGKFFFANIDRTDGGVELGLMYDALTDAMLLSNNEEASNGLYSGDQGGAIEHSTTGYMGLLMERYAVDFFINPSTGVDTKYGNTGAFASLMMNTGAVIPDNNASINHGDAMELTNEQFFYAMFVTPTSTDSFVAAMEAVKTNDAATATMFMDNIFLGQGATQTDSIQGSYNIIAIGSGMYEGLFGDSADNTNNGYGFGAYTDAFIGFAGLIPSDRYLPYAMAFMDAGYMYAGQANIDIWESAKQAWENYTNPTPAPAYAGAPSRSAGAGVLASEWWMDSMMVFGAAWDVISFSNVWDIANSNNDTSFIQGLIDGSTAEATVAYNTVIDGRNAANEKVYPTTIYNTTAANDVVYGFHGLIELAIREDMVNTGGVADMDAAIAAFTLPAFSEITWNYAYTAATDGISGYWTNVIDADWLADLSTNDLVREYFYPGADNAYIPSWLMAIDWLKVPTNANTSFYEAIDFDYDAGYMDVYIVSANTDLMLDTDLEAALAPIKDNIEFTKVDMDSDSIIAVDANGQTLDGLYVYKIRVVTPEDTEAVLAALAGLGDDALNAIGIETDNAAQTPAP